MQHLRKELKADPELLGVSVISLDTWVCQNTCSGHGTCDQATRECTCQPAWMENWLQRNLGSGEANCEWSLVYVSLAAGTSVLLVLVCCCLTTCKRRVVKMRAKRKYTRLSTADNIEMSPGIFEKMSYYSCICFKGFMTRFYYLPKDKKQQKIK